MAESQDWKIADALQPKAADYSFDLDEVLLSVVSLRAEIPPDAFTASILGTERSGNGVVIGNDGLVLTIGYLITEAETVWLLGNTGTACPAHVVAYDQETGFGLVQALERLNLPALKFGDSDRLEVGSSVVMGSFGGASRSLAAKVIERREFAGYWEYVLDEAIFTSPAHPQWGGSAVIGDDGRLYGIGSLFVQQAGSDGQTLDGNMVVPINVLKPILDELRMFGGRNKPARPWLGMYTAEADDRLVVAGLAEDGPAHDAGVEPGDFVVGVAGQPVLGLADLFRKVWKLGDAGAEVPLSLIRQGKMVELRLRSIDRNRILKAPRLH